MEKTEGSISVITPLGPAVERVKTMLFKPFKLEKWLVIGFCAWLAFLGSSGGGGGTGPTTGGDFGSGSGMENIKEGLRDAKNWVIDNMDWLLQLAFVVAVVLVALWLLVLWLSSRGRFMFLYCVAGDRAEVARPWREYASQGNSLFVFRLVLGVIGLLAVLPFLAGAGWSVYSMISDQKADTGGIVFSVSLVLVALGAGMFISAIAKLTQDFVVPIMYLRALSCWDGWRELRSLLGQHFWMMMLYLLFQVALLFAIQMATFLIVLVTCCIAGCLLAIPYLGTVFFLPVLVFQRSYSLYFLAQFGPRYNVFPPEAE